MSKQANPTLIGAFVVGAIGLLALAIAIFGGAELFARKTVLVSYFDGSVKGLRVGADVAFRGVRVGFVRNIELLTDIDTLAPKIEITMELLPETMKLLREGQLVSGGLVTARSVDQLVKAGFSAQLGSESFVTGQLLVELDFRPNQDLQLYSSNPPYPEIPSVTSEIQQAIQRLQDLAADIEQNVDLGALSTRLLSTLEGLDELANSKDLREAITGANRLVNAEITQQLSASLQGTIADLRVTITESRALIQQSSDLIKSTEVDVDSLFAEIQPAAARLSDVLEEAEKTLREVRKQVAGDSTQMYQLRSTLAEVESAAESIKAFFEYMERNPEALLRGKRQ